MSGARFDIREQMPVRSSDGQHLGKVDRIIGDRLRLAKSSDDTVHHWVPLAVVLSCQGGEVRLACTAQQVRESWQGGDMVGDTLGLPDQARWHSTTS
jgi:hypothetical protein